MKFSCMMELNKYPLDVQVCTMEVASCKSLPLMKLQCAQTQVFVHLFLHHSLSSEPLNSNVITSNLGNVTTLVNPVSFSL